MSSGAIPADLDSDHGKSARLSERLVDAAIKAFMTLPNGALRASVFLGLIRIPGVSRVAVDYMADGVPLTLQVFVGHRINRIEIHESVFHFNGMIGWHLGLDRSDIEREGVRIGFGRYHLVRDKDQGPYGGFHIKRKAEEK